MANINDYIKWRGDLTLAMDPFNEIDSMILARFSYLLFDKISLSKKETIGSLADKMKDFKDSDFRYHGDMELIYNLGHSNRFKNMVVTDYVQKNDSKTETQFSAITIHLSHKELYLSFIGTDNSLIGWKEDFNMTFMDHVPAQLHAKAYVEMIARKYPYQKLHLGGHSKGGNVAIYAALFVPKRIQNRILQVRNYDGPGFDAAIFKMPILSKIKTYIPQDSVIGRLLNHVESYEVVKSVEKGLYQHDIYSWQVLGKELVLMSKVSQGSELVNQTIQKWLQQTTPMQRKIFIDEVFSLLYATSVDTFRQMNTHRVKTASLLLKNYKELSDDEKKMISAMIKELGKSYAAILSENAKLEKR